MLMEYWSGVPVVIKVLEMKWNVCRWYFLGMQAWYAPATSLRVTLYQPERSSIAAPTPTLIPAHVPRQLVSSVYVPRHAGTKKCVWCYARFLVLLILLITCQIHSEAADKVPAHTRLPLSPYRYLPY